MKSPRDPRLSRPLYTLSEAAEITRVPASRLRNWVRGYSRGGKHFEPLLETMPANAHSAELSFLDVVEAMIIAACRRQGVSLSRLRNARRFAREWLDCEHPFATRDFSTDGYRVFYEFERSDQAESTDTLLVDIGEGAGQALLPGYLHDVVALLDFADCGDGWATAIHPCGREGRLVVDPQIRSGQVVVEANAILVDAVWRRHLGGDPTEFIAEDLGIQVSDVESAVAFKSAA